MLSELTEYLLFVWNTPGLLFIVNVLLFTVIVFMVARTPKYTEKVEGWLEKRATDPGFVEVIMSPAPSSYSPNNETIVLDINQLENPGEVESMDKVWFFDGNENSAPKYIQNDPVALETLEHEYTHARLHNDFWANLVFELYGDVLGSVIGTGEYGHRKEYIARNHRNNTDKSPFYVGFLRNIWNVFLFPVTSLSWIIAFTISLVHK